MHQQTKFDEPEINLTFRDKLADMLAQVSRDARDVKKLLERFKANNDAKIDKELKDEIAKRFRNSSQVASRANNFFDLIFRSISEKQRETDDPHMVDSKLRMTHFLAVLLKRKLDLKVQELNRLQLQAGREYQCKIERTLKIYKPGMDEMEIKQLSQDPKKMNEFIQQYMMMSPQFEDAVREIDERLSEIKELEKGMNKLLAMIKELHNIVKQQNVVVDSITQTMANIKDHTEKTYEEMESAKQYQVNTKQKMVLLFIILLVVVIGFLNHILGWIIK